MRTSVVDSKQTSGNSLRVELAFDARSLQLTPTPFGVIVELGDCRRVGEPGAPALPAKTIRVALPPGTKPVSLEVTDTETKVVGEGPFVPAPVQPPQPGGQATKAEHPACQPGRKHEEVSRLRLDALLESLREEKIPRVQPPPVVPAKPESYRRAGETPLPFAEIKTVEVRSANPVAVVKINPVRLAQGGRLELTTRATLMIEYVLEPPASSGKARRQSQRLLSSPVQAARDAELTKALVINPDWVVDLSEWFTRQPSHVDYLIISDNFAWDSNPLERGAALNGDVVAEFQRLANWKRRRGLTTLVVTISQIVDGAYGNFRSGTRDLQEVIRNFLKHAHSQWGVAWLVLGGDVNVVPVRQVLGFAAGAIGQASTDPPQDNQFFWTGSFTKLRAPGANTGSVLVNPEAGLIIPYDATGASGPSQRGWFFTDSSYTTRSTTPTNFLRVNGPTAEVDGPLQWIQDDNQIPTDLYYASLTGSSYGFSVAHDWDRTNCGVYGMHVDGADAGGVEYEADLSVGRVPVSNAIQTRAFVDKLIAYESFRRPDGSRLDDGWTPKMLIGAANWGGRYGVYRSNSNPPPDFAAFQTPGAQHVLINTKDALPIGDWRVIVQVTEADLRVSPYDRRASATQRGWYFARSATDHSASEVPVPLWGMLFWVPIATQWIVLFGPAEEVGATAFILDHTQPDGSLSDQEQLRQQIVADFPAIDRFQRLYEDEVDLSPAQQAAAPFEHLTEARMLTRINEAQHFVSLSGHGWWGGCCGYGLNTSENAANGYHSYIAYADSCLTNQFDVDDAVSERSLFNANGGAVAYVGNSRYSWIGVGDNYQRAFFRRLSSTRHLGLAADSRCALLGEATGFWPRYNKWAIFALNLMGDPEMPVWIGSPRQLRAQFKTNLDKRQAFEVVVTTRTFLSANTPLPGAVVTVSQGSLFRQAVTDLAGRVTLDVRDADLGALDLTVTKIAYEPFQAHPEVVGPVWITGTVVVIAHQHPRPEASFVDLELTTPIGRDTRRGWCALRTRPDYGIILDAATDAYVSTKPIALFVDSIHSGGIIEKFRFGNFDRMFSLAPDLEFETAALSKRLGTVPLTPAPGLAPEFPALQTEPRMPSFDPSTEQGTPSSSDGNGRADTFGVGERRIQPPAH